VAVAKRKMTRKQIRRAKGLAERMKGKRGIRNPNALARWRVRHPAKRRRR